MSAETRPTAAGPDVGTFAGLTALGTLAALWALFLWTELLAARSGGAPSFCGAGDTDGCTALWNAGFATTVHRYTGLPLAAWGLVWGIVAFALPLLALWRAAEGRAQAALVSAIRFTAAAGVAAVIVLFGVSAVARALCIGCFGIYVVVAGYAGIALYGWKGLGLPDSRRGAAWAAGSTIVVALLLLYPGLRTPKSADDAARDAVTAVPPPGSPATADAGDAERDRYLTALIQALSPPMQQTLSDSLHLYQRSPAVAPPPPRHLTGPSDAPVRITEWTDVLCTHCAALHRTLDDLRQRLPPESFSVDSREFPLDGSCNPMLTAPKNGASVRCIAAKARLCVDPARHWELAGALFEQQEGLTVEKVYATAERFTPRRSLEACIASDATQRALEEDIRLAAPYEPDATPIVTVNGRRGTSFGPFLYAMVLAGGNSAHPAFRALPAPNPQAHLH